MDGKIVATEPTHDDAVSYLTSMRETLHGDPAKFKEFIKLLVDLKARRVHVASFIARAKELFKDHPKLLSGLNAFLPDQAKIFIPPEPELPDNIERKRYVEELNKIKVNLKNMVIKTVATEPTFDDPVSYILAVKEALLDGEPAKYKDFLDLLDDHLSRRVDEASFFARAEQIFKDHPNLLPGASILIPEEATIYRIISPEPEQPTELPDHIVIKHKDADHLLNMIKTRFERLDTHVPKGFVKIVNEFNERKKSEEEVREEVIDLLYYHEDLIDEFLRLLQ